ncbi:MAG: CCA tRNA nucleotidyltransferase [Aerococcus sp.]|nr:CCA tRNA nucleotidyltransferase [Aerococcus sp.]
MVQLLKTTLQTQSAFKEALPVLTRIQSAGYEAYFVGGSIRDALLNKPIHDIDIATSAYPSEVQAIFPKHFDVGLEHGTVMALVDGETYEITTFRTESGYQDYRRPDQVTFVRQLEDDLLRRDFTINALAMDTTGQVWDYFTGLADLETKTLRAVGQAKARFHEDALRMMRAVRFMSQLDFTLDPETEKALAANAPLLAKIAVERVRVEMEKLWVGVAWQRGIEKLVTTELYRFCPLLSNQAETLSQLEQLLSEKVRFTSAELAWAVLVFVSEQGEEPLSVDKVSREWKLSNKQKQKIATLVDALNVRIVGPWQAVDVYQVGIVAAKTVEEWITHQQQAHAPLAQQWTPGAVDELEQTWAALPIHSKKELALNGGDIIQTFHPDDKPQIGAMLNAAEEAVVAGVVINERVAILEYLAHHF